MRKKIYPRNEEAELFGMEVICITTTTISSNNLYKKNKFSTYFIPTILISSIFFFVKFGSLQNGKKNHNFFCVRTECRMEYCYHSQYIFFVIVGKLSVLLVATCENEQNMQVYKKNFYYRYIGMEIEVETNKYISVKFKN